MIFTFSLVILTTALLTIQADSDKVSRTCDIAETNCLPILDFKFEKNLPKKAPEEVALDLNNFLSAKKWAKRNIEIRSTASGEYSLFAKEEIRAGEPLMVIGLENLFWFNFFNYELLDDFPEKEIHKLFRIPTFVNYNQSRNIMVQPFYPFALQFLYHLYHFQHSHLKEDLQALPRKIDAPILTLGKKELNAIDPAIRKFILDQRELIYNSYLFFTEELQYYWNEEQINSFFGEGGVPIQDFVYAFDIYNGVIPNNNAPNVDFGSKTYIPIVNQLKPLKKLSGEKKVYLTFQKEGEFANNFVLTAPFDLALGEEIRVELSLDRSNLNYILVKNLFPKSETECLFMEVLEKSLAEQWHFRSNKTFLNKN